MRALNLLLVSSSVVVFFFGVAFVSALLTATVYSQLHSPKEPPISIAN